MKLFKQLKVSGVEIPLVNDDVRLQLNTPGRAYFVTSTPVEKGIVELSIGYDKEKIYRYFFGFIESVTKIDNNHYSLFCQELGAALNRRIVTNIRHVTMRDVLKELSAITKLQFVIPDKDYSNTKAACFYSIGGGYHCLDTLSDVYQIDNFIWQQQTDGKIFVGGWEDSRWKTRNIAIADKWLVGHGVANSAEMPVIPNLRPGVYIQGRGLVTKLAFKLNNIKISWSDSFWTKPLKSW